MRLTTLLLLCMALIGCEKEVPVYSGTPLVRGGILHGSNSNAPLTATVERYHENGQLEILYTVINGKEAGYYRLWHDNGTVK